MPEQAWFEDLDLQIVEMLMHLDQHNCQTKGRCTLCRLIEHHIHGIRMLLKGVRNEVCDLGSADVCLTSGGRSQS